MFNIGYLLLMVCGGLDINWTFWSKKKRGYEVQRTSGSYVDVRLILGTDPIHLQVNSDDEL